MVVVEVVAAVVAVVAVAVAIVLRSVTTRPPAGNRQRVTPEQQPETRDARPGRALRLLFFSSSSF